MRGQDFHSSRLDIFLELLRGSIVEFSIIIISRFNTGISHFCRQKRQAQRVAFHDFPASLTQCFPQMFQHLYSFRQFPRIPLRRIAVETIQRLQNQIRRTGRAKKLHCFFCFAAHLFRPFRRKLQICPSCQHRQGFMRGIAGHCRAKVNGMFRRGQKFQVCPMCVIHQKRHAGRPANLRQPADIRTIAQIIRRGDINRNRFFRQPRKPFFHLFRRNRAGTKQAFLLRKEPFHFQIQQCAGIMKGFVRIPSCQNSRASFRFFCFCRLQCKEQHGTDTLRRAFRSIDRFPRPEKLPRVFLTLRNYAVRLV